MEGKQQVSRQTAAIVATSTIVGPIPPPDVLRQYKEIRPETVDMIFQMAKDEADHRHRIQDDQWQKKSEELTDYHSEIKRGQYLAFVVTIIAISCATACAYLGQSSAACVIAGATLVNLATVFIGRKK